MINTTPVEGFLTEAAVCAAHEAAIRNGETWLVDASRPEGSGHGAPDPILMGDDLAARDFRQLTRAVVVGDATYSPAFGKVERLILETEVFGGARQDSVEILLTPDAIKILRNVVKAFDRRGT